MSIPSPAAIKSRLGPEEGLVLNAELVGAAYCHRAASIGVAVHDALSAKIIAARVKWVGVRSERRVDGREDGQRLVVDLDRPHGSPRRLRRLRRDQGNRLPVVAHTVDSEHRLVRQDAADELLARNVVGGQDGVHARHACGCAGVDRNNPGGRVRAPQRCAVEHPVDAQVR